MRESSALPHLVAHRRRVAAARARIVPRVHSRLTSLVRLLVVVYALGSIVLVSATIPLPSHIELPRLLFWILITVGAAALPVDLPGGLTATMTTAPLLATAFDASLPQPFAVVWVAVIGTIEPRDLRREVVWYGSIYNKLNYALAGYSAWVAISLTGPLTEGRPVLTAFQIALAGSAFVVVNSTLSVLAASARTGTPARKVFLMSLGNVGVGIVSQVPLGWLMAEIALKVGEWATVLFIVPLLLARYSYTKYTEIRELFFGSVSALSQAIDAKDGFTRGHADRVSRIAGAVAREMDLSEREIEHIELAALLHDIGKIGVEDRILMKPTRLEPDETELMRRHPIYGASIVEPSPALRPLAPIIIAHHENYDGSGYPRGLKGDDIPIGARIILVSDAYEAMTSDRIYRKAIGHEKALEQLSKYKGVQFDPKVVRALDALLQKHGATAFEVSDLPAIEYETLAQLRQRLAHGPVIRDAHAG
jgi:HD-GYP domain-containing protein (c-di-GMP phosphodiesterase class II)